MNEGTLNMRTATFFIVLATAAAIYAEPTGSESVKVDGFCDSAERRSLDTSIWSIDPQGRTALCERTARRQTSVNGCRTGET